MSSPAASTTQYMTQAMRNRQRRRGAVAALMLLACACGDARGQCQYQVTVLPEVDCGLFGGLQVTAINNLGHIAAYGHCADEIPVVWTGGDTLTFLPIPPGYSGARPEDINDLNEVVGWVRTPSAQQQACLWRNGEAVLLGIPPGANSSFATGINNKSEICGYSHNSVTGPLRAFIWRDGVMIHLELPVGPNSIAEDINDSSQITGWMGQSDAVGCEAFVWSGGAMLNLGVVPGGIAGQGVAIGDNGMVSGFGKVPTKENPFRRESVQWRGTQAVNCGMLPLGEQMIALGGNDFATVGLCDRPSKVGNRGFLFQDGVLSDLTNLIQNGVIYAAFDINQHGQIIAEGRLNNGTVRAMVLARVGEPAGDITHDCRVTVEDLIAVIWEWGSADSYADADNDGAVDIDDLIMVILNWNS